MTMYDAQGTPPRERLVEVLLEETLRARPDAARARGAVTGRWRWLAAAIALLGVGVVVATARLARPDAGGVAPAQDPSPPPSPRRGAWHSPGVTIASQADWDAVATKVTGVLCRVVRIGEGGLEEVDAASDYVAGPAARDLAALVPALGDTPFGPAAGESPPFDAYIGFEVDGRRVHGFVRLWNQPTLVLGSRRVTSLPEGMQRQLGNMVIAAGRRLQVARGMVSSAEELAEVPSMAKAIRCPPPPNGALERHLGRFQQLEHLEFVFTTNLGAGLPISIQLPEVPTTLFDELKVLPNLRHLRCSGALLDSDDRVRELSALPKLRSLRLDGAVVLTDAGVLGGKVAVRPGLTVTGMRMLARQIDSLELVDCDVTPALLEPWLEAAQLRRLVVFGDAMAPELLARFARLPTLEVLGLGGVDWTDAHLQALAGSRITSLRLEHTKVTTPGLRDLPRSLRVLDLRRQQFHEIPHATLQMNLPECRILRAGDVDPDDPDPFAGFAGTTRR